MEREDERGMEDGEGRREIIERGKIGRSSREEQRRIFEGATIIILRCLSVRHYLRFGSMLLMSHALQVRSDRGTIK